MIRIFIGTSPNGEDDIQEKILEYSINKFTSEPYEIVWMRNRPEDEFFGNCNTQGWSTPFTPFRWFISEYCNFEGRALYMDVDMLVLDDLSKLYNIDLKDKAFATRPGGRTCVMVIDCEKAKKVSVPVSAMKNTYGAAARMRTHASNFSTTFGKEWNCLDGENLPIDEIKILHFTNMSTQPWRPSWYKGIQRIHKRKDVVQLWENYKNEYLHSLSG